MDTYLETVDSTLSVISELMSGFDIKPSDSRDPLVFAGVVQSDMLDEITTVVESYFGKAYKPAGKSAFFRNYTDQFVRDIGGIRKEQTVFRKAITDTLDCYCAFWPWGSDPVNTTVRIGVLCDCGEIGTLIYPLIMKNVH